METPEQRIRRIAHRQAGAITRQQATAAGFTDHQVRRRIDRGEWQRLDHGVYLLYGEPTTTTRLAAAVAALPAVVSHSSAAELHELVGNHSETPEVTVPHRYSNRFAGVVVHESTDLDPDHITEVAGMPVTNPARTIFDMALLLGERRLQRTVDRAIVRRQTTVDELRDLLLAIGRRGRPGTAAMREMLSRMTDSYVAPESELEQRLLELLSAAGLPRPELQMALPWRTVVDGRVDAAYRQHRLIIECDGRRWHTLADSFERDRRRDNLAQLAGWRVLRFTWTDVTSRPNETIRQIRSACARAVG